jgi:hypothetical protein
MADTFNTFKAAYGGDTTVTGFIQPDQALIIACSDETTDLTAGSGKVKFRIPYDFKVDKLKASVNTAPTGADIVVSAVTGSTTIGTVTIGVTTKTSSTTVNQQLADDAEISINVTQVGSTAPGNGLKLTLIGRKQSA